EGGEPGPQGATGTLPLFTADVAPGPVLVTIDGPPEAPFIHYFQPPPDTTVSYTWFGSNTFTGPTQVEGLLKVEVGDNIDDGLYPPGSTVTTTLIATAPITLGGITTFDQGALNAANFASAGFAFLHGTQNFADLNIN